MKDLLKLALIAGGGFWLYTQFFSGSEQPEASTGDTGARDTGVTSPPVTPPPTSNPPPPPPPATPPKQEPPPPVEPTLEQKIRKLAAKPGAEDKLTYDQWNYYYQKVTGNYAPAIEDVFPALIRSALMTYREFEGGISRFGLGRLRRLRGVSHMRAW